MHRRTFGLHQNGALAAGTGHQTFQTYRRPIYKVLRDFQQFSIRKGRPTKYVEINGVYYEERASLFSLKTSEITLNFRIRRR